MYYFKIWMLLFIKNSTWNRNLAKSQQCEGVKAKKRRLLAS